MLVDAFEDLIQGDPPAFREVPQDGRGPFAFYRGTACLFYEDVAGREDPWVDDRTRRVWIQGDLHAENYGTYMDSDGMLVFDMNDFDEAYVGHYTWDLQRMAASLALLGYSKALSDARIRGMIKAYAPTYLEQVRAFHHGEEDEEFRLTLDNTEGALHDVLQRARLQTRWHMLEQATHVEGHERVFKESSGARPLDDNERKDVFAAYATTWRRFPSRSANTRSLTTSRTWWAGWASASGAPACLRTTCSWRVAPRRSRTSRALDEAGQRRRPQPRCGGRAHRDLLRASGPPHRDLPARAAGPRRPLAGLVRTARQGSGGAGDLALRGRLVGTTSPILTRSFRCSPYLGQATAKVHCVSDAGSGEELVDFETEEAIEAVIDDDLVSELAVSARVRRAGPRGPPAVRRCLSKRPDPRRLNPAALGGHQDGLGAIHRAELRVSVVQVGAHRARGELELVGDLLVDLALGKPLEHLDLAGRERARVDVALRRTGALRQLVHDRAQPCRW